jgi:hypothetical protein
MAMFFHSGSSVLCLLLREKEIFLLWKGIGNYCFQVCYSMSVPYFKTLPCQNVTLFPELCSPFISKQAVTYCDRIAAVD